MNAAADAIKVIGKELARGKSPGVNFPINANEQRLNPWSTDAFGSVSIAVSKLKPIPLKEVVYFQPILSNRYRPQT
jgi:hypothetical protein